MIPDKIVDPIWLLLIFFVFILVVWSKKTKNNLNISAKFLIGSSPKMVLNGIINFLRQVSWLIVFVLLVLIIARPLKLVEDTYQEKEVRQISISVDVSMSMSGEGTIRIKEILDDFVQKRKGDQIAITVYSGHSGQEGGAGIIRHLTSNTADIRGGIRMIESKMLGIFTALGEGVFASVISLIIEDLEYLKEEKGISLYSKDLRKAIKNPRDKNNERYLEFFCEAIGQKKNRVIIIFTDGIYNTGIHPLASIGLAKKLGIRMYMVALLPRSATGVSKIEGLRRRAEIAKAVKGTGGAYFNGEDYDDIEKIYEELDKIEKGKVFIKKTEKLEDNYSFYAMIALLIFACRMLVQYVWIRYP